MLIGSNIIYREKVSSTNVLAAEMLSGTSVPEGSVIYAGEQYSGKGQRANTWHSEAGKNLTMSIILYPHFLQADRQFMLSKVLSLAISELLDPYSGAISIKWPNDIYHKDDKIAGILIEYSIEGKKIKHCIAGSGININQVDFPPEIPNPVSLHLINRREYDTAVLLSDFCRICDLWYKKLMDGSEEEINKQYQQRLYRLNKLSGYVINGKMTRAMIQGVDRYGRLELRMEDGSTGIFGFDEIKFSPRC
ncbi:MAG: biotin--[acetyl-CoA-carboxylase] ligase [Bacteroidota bacterium]